MIAEPFTILCAAGNEGDLSSLCRALEDLSGGEFKVGAHSSGEALTRALEERLAVGEQVPLVIVDEDLGDGSGADALIDVAGRETGTPTRKVLMVAEPCSDSVHRAIEAGALDRAVCWPWSDSQVRAIVHEQVTGYFLDEQADHPVSNAAPDVRPLLKAYSVPVEGDLDVSGQMQGRRMSLLGDRDLSDDQVERAMIDALDRVLHKPERSRLPAGTLIVTEGEPIDGITVVLEGRIRLFRKVEGHEVAFHHRTAGRIIGLLALARSGPAFFSVRAETDLTVISLSLEQLDAALRRSPTLAVHFVWVILRSLARRSLRSVEQQLQIRQSAQTKIRESERLAVIGQLAAGVAHELNNPLQGIVTYAHLLLEQTDHDDRTRTSIEKIVTQADRCRTIIRGLLDFSRPHQPLKQLADMNALLRDSVRLVEGQALFHNIVVGRDPDADLPLVMADPSQIQQVFINLIMNAAEAMEGSGHLTLATRVDALGEDVEIEIRDTGPGMAEGDLDRVFDPFFSTKEAAHGTGLGLAICHGIVREHGGSISVASEPGFGATFLVRLPINAEESLDVREGEE